MALSCQWTEKTHTIPLEDLKISIQEKIKRSLEKEYLEELTIDSTTSKLLNDFYNKRNYEPKWINDSTLTEEGKAVQKILSQKIKFGIPDERYKNYNLKNKSFLSCELLITTTLAFLGNDLKNGFIDNQTLSQKALRPVALEVLEKISDFKSDSLLIEAKILKFGIADSNYQKLGKKLIEYCSNYPLDTTNHKITFLKNDKNLIEKNTRKALVTKGYLKNEIADSNTFITALKLFQIHNGLYSDGVIGVNTIFALNENTVHKLLRTALVMEKWRWKHEYPKKYIALNIPEYLLRFYLNDTLKSIHKMIVGKPETPTPELISKIYQIIVYPYWNVPQSIAKKEILENLKKDPHYLTKNHFKIFRNTIEINPNTVRWSKIKKNTFPYKIRQDYGPENSLGVVKFEFHNHYGVYIHDTPSKELFKKEIRSFSHGCMRCENPLILAKLILENDNNPYYTSTYLDSLLLLKKQVYIQIKHPVPLFVEYKTVTVSNNILTFHMDVYRRDEKYIRLMVDTF